MVFFVFIAFLLMLPPVVHAGHGSDHPIILLGPPTLVFEQQLVVRAGNPSIDDCSADVTVSVSEPNLAQVLPPSMGSGNDLFFTVLANSNNKTGLFKITVAFAGVDANGGEGPCTATGSHVFSSEVFEPIGSSTGNTPFSGINRDPVNSNSGELFFNETPDLFLGGSMPLYFQRYYASYLRRSFVAGELGDNWRHNFEWAVHWVGNNLVLMDDKGKVIRYTSDGVGNWTQQTSFEVPYQLLQNGQEIDLYNPETGLFYNFDAYGRLAKVEDGKGNAHTLSYNIDGKPDKVTDGLGRSLVFTYTTIGSLNKLTKVTEQQNGINKRSVSFSYDATGDNLLQFMDANLKTTIYTYFPPDGADRGELNYKTFPEGNTHYTQTYYNTADGVDSGKVKTQTDSLTNTHTFTYSGSTATMTDPLTNTRVHTHTATGQLSSHTGEDGLTLDNGFDSSGRRNSISDRLGDLTSYTYDPQSGKVASVTHADGTTTNLTYTPRATGGFVVNDLTKITHQDGTTEIFTYDASGNILSYTDPSGNVWFYTYNGKGQILTATNPESGVMIFSYNADGTVLTRTDPSINTTNFVYDVNRRLIKITYADTRSRTYSYDDNNNLLSILDEKGQTTVFTYDSNGNLKSVTDALSGTTQMGYDPMDRVQSIANPLSQSVSRTYDELERLLTVTDRNGNTTTYGYDSRGRLISIASAGGQIWSRTIDAESIISSITNPLLKTWNYSSDKLGRLSEITTPLTNTSTLTRDLLGRVTNVTDSNGDATDLSYFPNGFLESIVRDVVSASYVRNSLGQPTEITDGNGNQWKISYDTAGRLTSTTDPNGKITTHTYDNRNRIMNIDLPASSVDYTFDDVGNLTNLLFSDATNLDYGYDALNRLTSGTGLSLLYDSAGRMINSNNLTMTRDANGNIKTLTLALGKTVTYFYNDRNLLESVTDWVPKTTTFTYDDARQLIGIDRPNGVNTVYTYDDDGRRIGITDGALSSISLTRDGEGQITGATKTVPLSPAITAENTANYSYDPASQLSAHTYDSMGHLTVDGTRTYVWDLASRLTSYTESANTVSFTYDALGNRLSRTESGVTRDTVWNYAFGLPSISVEKETAADLRYYIHTPGGRLLYSIEASDNSRRDYHYDEMGNTLFLTDNGPAVIGSYAYGPYGELIGSSGALDNAYLYQGQSGVRQEGTSGLYYMRARYYDSETGRFLSRDLIKTIDPRAINPYQYALGNPKKYIDPTGLFNHEENEHEYDDPEIDHTGQHDFGKGCTSCDTYVYVRVKGNYIDEAGNHYEAGVFVSPQQQQARYERGFPGFFGNSGTPKDPETADDDDTPEIEFRNPFFIEIEFPASGGDIATPSDTAPVGPPSSNPGQIRQNQLDLLKEGGFILNEPPAGVNENDVYFPPTGQNEGPGNNAGPAFYGGYSGFGSPGADSREPLPTTYGSRYYNIYLPLITK